MDYDLVVRISRWPEAIAVTKAEPVMDDIRSIATSQELIPPTSAIPETRRCLTYEQLSMLTGISLSTLRRRVKDGAIPFFQPGGHRSRIVFPPDIVERLMQGTIADPNAKSEPPQPQKEQHRGPRPNWQRGTQS